MTYATPAALRAAIDARLANEARATGARADRLRRRLAFERVLARLAEHDPGRWILKGGMALELRWLERARTTKDLDLATRHDVSDAATIQELLLKALSGDPDRDMFDFEVGRPQPISADMAGRPGWRAPVTAVLAGRSFATFSLDIVTRTEELAATETVRLPGALAFAGVDAREIEAVNLAQHFAEKVHAMTRTYGDEQPSSRVRDLVDLVLMIEEDPPAPPEVRAAVEVVFAQRATHPIPTELGDPPADWAERYAEVATELEVEAQSLDEALELVRDYWRRTTQGEEQR